MNSIILTNSEINHKIRRIAYQIYECHLNYKEIVIAGIADNGFILAKKIQKTLKEISPLKVTICEVKIDKKNPLKPLETTLKFEDYQNKALVLIDDVLNSGTTLMYAVKHFLNVPLKQFKTAVLVDRNHKKYPVKVDFKGISLSTSLKERVQVVFKNNYAEATLV